MQCTPEPDYPDVGKQKVGSMPVKGILRYNSALKNEKISKDNCAVYIQNLCKRYNNGPPVLQNLSIHVQKGTVYGLLGSSGSGKSQVLSCVVGLTNCYTGDVLVFGKKPGSKESGIPGKRLGYMPQELALYNQLSIQEIIQFYGKIYNMKSTEVASRWSFLHKLLNLSTKFQQIGDLSGGQKRRASLALALLHSPELLVLDEPTVGLDPLLRRSIWNHLFNISSTLGTTIIMTTHYIEEARLSNTIGILRKGRLLAEDTPSNLLQTYNCALLEQVVLQLCRKDFNDLSTGQKEHRLKFKSSRKSNEFPDVVANNENYKLENGTFRVRDENVVLSEQSCYQSVMYGGNNKNKWLGTEMFPGKRNSALHHTFQRVYGLTTVLLLIFTRYPSLLGLILIMPSIQGSITLWSMGHKLQGMNLGVVNHDLSNWTTVCDSPTHIGNSCDLSALSCKYLNLLKSNDIVTLNPHDSEEDAIEQVKLGSSLGYIKFPFNYTQHCLDRAIAKRFALNESIVGSRIQVRLDYTQTVASALLVKHMLFSYLDYVKKLAESCDVGGREAEIPIFFRPPVYGSYDDDYTEFITPGVIVSSLMFIMAALTAAVFIADEMHSFIDRKLGTLSRARVAGLTTTDILSGYLLAQGIMIVGQIIIWNGILHFVFNFSIYGSLCLFQVICILSGLFGASFGIFLGIVCSDEVEASIVGIFIAPIFLLFGGVLWSISNMSRFWQYVSYLLPVTLATTSLRSIVTRGLGITNVLVWPGLVTVISWISVLIILSVFAYRKCK